MRAYLARHDVRRMLFVRYPEDGALIRHGGGNYILRLAQKSRAWMQNALCRGLENAPEVQNFLSGIVLGLRHQTPEDIEEPFQQTGTLHLFAVAGLHVGIVAALLWMLAMVARLSRKWAAALIIPLLLFYAAITGLHVSSIRAAVMSSILFGGLFFERKVFVLNSLAAAAFFLLCWNTNELFSTGFQLSFAVVGAIILFADPFAGLFAALDRSRSFSATKPVARSATLAARWLRMALPRNRCFPRGMARFVALGALVFLHRHTDFSGGEFDRGTDCFFHSRDRASVSSFDAASPRACGDFQ